MSVLGIDYGRRYIGLALALRTRPGKGGFTILPLDALRVDSLSQSLEKLSVVIVRYAVKRLVFGLPFSRSDGGNQMTLSVRFFADQLKKYLSDKERGGVSIYFVDETLTTFAAARQSARVKRASRRMAENSLAAVFILENFLNQVRQDSQSVKAEKQKDNFAGGF